MANRNTTDHIEAYINELLELANVAELKRSDLASRFEVVPSQINYVIKTRFTASRGYVVESKRGGGGYIRIGRVTFSDHHELLQNLMTHIGQALSESTCRDMLQLLYDEEILTRREGNLLLATTTNEVLGPDADVIRAQMIHQILYQLDRKEK